MKPKKRHDNEVDKGMLFLFLLGLSLVFVGIIGIGSMVLFYRNISMLSKIIDVVFYISVIICLSMLSLLVYLVVRDNLVYSKIKGGAINEKRKRICFN